MLSAERAGRRLDSRRDAGATFIDRNRRGQNFQNCVQEIIYAAAVLGGDGKNVSDSQAVKFVGERLLLDGVDFIDGQEERAPGFAQQADQFEIGGGEFGASVDDHDDGGGLVEGDARLAENFRGDEIVVVGNDAAGVDDLQAAASPFRVAVETVAGDSGFVAYDSAARAYDAIEERGLAHVGAADDGDCGNAGGGGESAGRVVGWLGQS